MTTSINDDDEELPLEEAALLLRELGLYPNMTPKALWFMYKKLGWGPTIHYPPNGGGPFIYRSVLMAWLKREDELADERGRIEQTDVELKWKRPRPRWLIIANNCPELDDTIEVLKAYDCDLEVVRPGVVIDTSDLPDAAVIFVENGGGRRARPLLEELTSRGVYCLVLGRLSLRRMSAGVRRLSARLRLYAYNTETSPFSAAPAHLAKRMNIRAGLEFEEAKAYQERWDRAWYGYGR